MRGEFTGRKMAAILVGGFGVIIAVNFTMASFAISGFSGVVVENSYVASEKFNDWLEEDRRQQALGWNARLAREGNRLAITTDNVPGGAEVTAQIRRPLGEPEHGVLTFSRTEEQHYLSEEPLPPGRWIVRLTIDSGPARWRVEEHLP